MPLITLTGYVQTNGGGVVEREMHTVRRHRAASMERATPSATSSRLLNKRHSLCVPTDVDWSRIESVAVTNKDTYDKAGHLLRRAFTQCARECAPCDR